MKLSFKFKIALISFAVSGTLLTAFGIALFAFVYSMATDRMDSEIRALVEAPLRGPPKAEFWDSFGKSIETILGEERAGRIAVMVLDADDCVLFKTTNAPSQLASLPRPRLPAGLDQPPDFGGMPPPLDDPFSPPLDEEDGGRFSPGQGGPPERSGFPPHQSITIFHTLESDAIQWRAGIMRSRDKTVIVAVDMDAFNGEINRYRNAFMLAVLLGLLLLGIAGWFMAGRAMKPVAVMADTAEGITARGLDQRIPPVGNDVELERLVSVVNDMLERLEKSYSQAVRFSADAAHELQTPLTILQGELDNAIQTSVDGSVEQQRYGMLLEELSNLKAVVQKLLLLAHADEGRLKLNRQPVNLTGLVRDAAEDIEIMAPELEVHVEVPDEINLSADPTLLNHVIRNMTSNAAKYTERAGKVIFKVTTGKDRVFFTLCNSAPPIPEADRPLLFDRFHRVDKSRSAAGSGLGLSLAREIARAHGGDLVLDPYADGMVSFTLSLPAIER